MKISYRFFQNFDKKDVLRLKELGVTVKEGCDAYVAYEGTPAFETLKAFFGKNWRDNVSIVDTDFTEKERTESFYLNISATKMLGYPQPEGWDEDKGEQEPQYPSAIRGNIMMKRRDYITTGSGITILQWVGISVKTQLD